STELMNRISQEKENASKDTVKVSQCCEESRALLEKANKRCEEMQEILSNVEEDNMLKSKQAVEAIEALRRYESGEEGLANALKKIYRLHEKVNVRDKQIRELVAEINLANEIAMENAVLRCRLGISEDEAIPTHSVLSKQRKIEKVNERLALKLRASEEMRLQLKLEKNDLKRKLFQMSESLSGQRSLEKEKSDDINEQQSSVDGAVTEGNQAVDGYAEKIEELEKKYAVVVEENENLRIGMHEILQKLREYDATSNHLTIDTSTLERLLHALDARSVSGWYHPAMRLQNELLATREREMLLKERLSLKSKQSTFSLGSRNDSGNVCDDEENTADIDQVIAEEPDFGEQVLLKSVEIDRLNDQIECLKEEREQLLQSNDELEVTRKLYNELMEFTKSTDNEKDRILVETLERLKLIESNICAFQRKIEFLKAENDNMHNTMRTIEVEHLNILHGLRSELARKNSTLKKLEHQTSVEGRNLESEIERMKLETANFYTIFLRNIQEVDKDNLLHLDYENLARVGLVESNLAVDFMPKEEFKRIKKQLQTAQEEFKKQTIKNGHLEELLKISQEQLRSQQMLISKFSDEEISLRHLVADLQSSSNEKYLLVKTQKELDAAKEQGELLKLSNAKLKQSLIDSGEELNKLKEQLAQQELDFIEHQKDNELKIKFLSKSVKWLHESYNSFTPTYAVTDFVKEYAKLLELKKNLLRQANATTTRQIDEEYERVFAKLRDQIDGSQIQDKINLIKFESQCEYLTKQLVLSQEQIEQLQEENSSLKLASVETTRHWDTIELIFNGKPKPTKPVDKFFDKEVQVTVAEKPRQATPPATTHSSEHSSVRKTSDAGQMTDDLYEAQPSTSVPVALQKSLESQLKQAMMLASTRSALLLETESRLTECHGRIKLLERSLEDKEEQLRRQAHAVANSEKQDDNILSSTIGSLQNLLLEKDTTLSRYQELLKNERQDHSKTYDENIAQIRALKKAVDEMEQKVYDKQKEIDNLSIQLTDLTQLKAQHEAAAAVREAQQVESRQANKPELIYTDKLIENIFETDQKNEEEIEELKRRIKELESKLQSASEELRKGQTSLREMIAREKRAEKNLREKEAEIVALNERLAREHEDLREFTDNIASAQEIEQLKEMLEEKDRHIQDLTETLSQFHDDQQKFMNDTSLHSAEQVSQLSADLNRSEASNRVLKTQIEALKRQILSIQQREKQSRDLVKTLKNQLIKRPVISMKPDRVPTPREEQLARKLQQLETELLDTKDELRKQININENRRAKNAAELDLWNKQKRWQQMAEKLKVQLKEREVELDKLKVHFNSAKNTIVRLEREKAILEGRSIRGSSAGSVTLAASRFGAGDSKYTPADSPDSCTTEGTASDEASTEVNTFAQNSKEIIEALKNRIESQQRRIVAMELERKGSNAMTHELERMQEKQSNLEAQNIRLEAKALQLQLDNDMLRQSDESERLRSQIKHLEEYIIVLKEELSKRCSRCSTSGSATNSELVDYNSKLEQTVLALRRVVEKLKVENKQLKENKPCPMTTANDRKSALGMEHDKLQQNYTEALNRVAALQVEVELLSSVTCPRCHPREGASQESEPDLLEKKTQLLEKAKILLSRAAAKERYLKEQIALLRRKCSDLQNVPVIDEISE
ncbi:AAEL005809-PA, partial [Aedes aegypti]